MAFERECTAPENTSGVISLHHRRVRLEVIHQQRAVQPDLHLFSPDQNVQLGPFVVVGERLVHVADTVKRAGLPALAVIALTRVSVVDLNLEPFFRPPFRLEPGVKVNARLSPWARHDLRPQLEVLETRIPRPPGVKQVRTRSTGCDLPVHDPEGAAVLAGLPAVERAAVKERYPVGVRAERSRQNQQGSQQIAP